MKKCRKLLVMLLSAALLIGTVAAGVGALSEKKHWVGSWSAGMTDISVTLLEGKENTDGIKISPFVKNMTARIRLTPTLGGNRVRFCLSNENGSSPLVIDEASIARAKGDSGSEIVEGSSLPVTFNGSRRVSIPAGGTVYCDPIDMEVRALEDLCVTYYAQDFGKVRTMALHGATTYLTFGNRTEDTKLKGISLSLGTLVSVVPLLSSLDVYADAEAYAIVVIGDSTTSNDIPKLLAKRIIEETGENKVGVLQRSIVGNCLLSDGVGPTGSIYGKAMIDRFQKDALDQSGVKYTLVKIGLNDILHPRCYSMMGLVPEASVEELIAGYRKLIDMAHADGMKIVFAEMSPWKGYTRDLLKTGQVDLEWTPETQALCDQLTQWIRTTEDSDGSINLDCLKAHDDPTKMPDDFTSDGAHLLAPAQEAFVAAIDLSLFGVEVPERPVTTKDAAQPESATQPEPATQPQTAQPDKATQADTATQAAKREEIPKELPIADTGDSLVVSGSALAALSACGLLIVTRKKKET